METKVDEIAEGIFRLSTWVAEIAPPAGFTFNQFLVNAEEPLLFHTGQKWLFPLLHEAMARVMDPAKASVIIAGDVKTFGAALKAKRPDLEVIPVSELDLDSPTLRKAVN